MDSNVRRFWVLELDKLRFESGSRRIFLVNGKDIALKHALAIRVWIGNTDRNTYWCPEAVSIYKYDLKEHLCWDEI